MKIIMNQVSTKEEARNQFQNKLNILYASSSLDEATFKNLYKSFPSYLQTEWLCIDIVKCLI